MATYVNDLRLKEIGTGESSGTWGSETNTNLELIGEALGFGTEAITTNADTHTTTVADGSTDPGRAMYLKYTGTLDSACTITIAPNTMSRMHFIENGTSGSQNIIISQGTGANVTIPAGDVKAVYLDGAGSGAAVVDAFASLSTVDLKVQDDLTVTDDVSIGGATTIGGVLDITDTTDSSDATGDTGALRTEGGASIAKKLFVGTDLDVDGTTNLDVVDIDGAVDMASTLQVDGAITSSAGATITLADNTDNLTLTTTDADASVGPNLKMYRNSGSPADNDLLGAIDFEGRNDNSQDVVYSQIFTQILDASDGTEDGYLSFKVMNAGTSRQRLLFDAGETVFNDESEDVDFRVESNGNANMLFVDAGNNRVGVGTTSPGQTLSVDASGGANFFVSRTSQTGGLYIESDGTNGIIRNPASNPILLQTNGANTRASVTNDGITFNGDTAAANALDDYEEGSWTVAVISSGGSGTYTVSNGYGYYNKTGNMVTVGGSFDLSISSADSGNMQISGLPFSCSSNGTRPLYVGPVGYTINVVPQPEHVTMGNGDSVAILDVWEQGNNNRMQIADWDNGGRMNFQITYESA